MQPVRDGWDGFCGFGVGLCLVGEDQWHVGLLQEQDETVRFVHLAWHYRLETHDPVQSFPQMYWANSGLDPDNREVMRVYTRLLANHTDVLAYGFDTDGSAFDRDTGVPLAQPPGRGFTCATFILAAHKFHGLELLDEVTWPARAEDAAWQRRVISLLREGANRSGDDVTAHVEALERKIDASAKEST